MKIGLTGGTGFLGQMILRMYGKDIRFVVPTSGVSRRELIEGEGIEYIQSDYSIVSFVKCFSGCDAVIHAGAKIPKAVTDPRDASAYLPNVISGVNVFEACRRLGIRSVVNISSGAVYDHRDHHDASEADQIVQSNNAYGSSKRCVEEFAGYYNRQNMGIKSLRLGKMLGVTDNNKAFWLFMNACARKEKIPIYGEGNSGYDYIYVKDAAAAAIYFLGRDVPGGIVNISYGACIQNKEFIPMLCDVFQNDKGYYFTGKNEPGDDFYMSNALAKELGWQPEYSMREALIDIHSEWEDKYDHR